jgi:phospholipase D1/2
MGRKMGAFLSMGAADGVLIRSGPLSVVQPARWSRWPRRLILLVYLGLALGLVLLWRDPAARHWLHPEGLSELGSRLRASPLGGLAVIGGYVLAVNLAVPVAVLVSVGSLVFGPWPGMAYAMGGMLSGALVGYGAGRLAGLALVDQASGGRLALLSQHLAQRGLWTVVLVRVLPVAPFLMVNVMTGALGVRLRDYLMGSFLGLLPATVLITLFLERLQAVWAAPGLGPWLLLGGVALAIAGSMWWFRRRVARLVAR